MRLILAALIFIAAAIPSDSRAAPSPSPTAHPTASAAPAPVHGGLEVEVVGMRNDNGEAGCSLFNDAKAFPRDEDKVYRHVWASIRHGRAACEFPGLPAGNYAAVVYHDENGNHKFDRNFLGMPKEGFGFSRDAPVRFGAPDFGECHFLYDGRAMYIVIHIRYWPL